jgi:hypothetical protein
MMEGMQTMHGPALHMQCIGRGTGREGYACICPPLRRGGHSAAYLTTLLSAGLSPLFGRRKSSLR